MDELKFPSGDTVTQKDVNIMTAVLSVFLDYLANAQDETSVIVDIANDAGVTFDEAYEFLYGPGDELEEA